MQILMISDVYFPRINGVSTSTQTFINELELLGHSVTLITPDYHGRSQTVLEQDSNIYRVPANKVPFDPEDRFMHKREIRKLLPKLRRHDFDIIHIQTPFMAHYAGLWLGRQLGIPCVETYHTFFEEYLYHYLPLVPKQITRYLARYFTTRQCNQVDQVIVPSTAMREVLGNYGVTTEITVLPTGLPLADFRRGDGRLFRQTFGIPPERPLLVTIGRVAHEKNIAFLFDVVTKVREQIPDILLVLAGEGPMLAELKHRVEKEGLEENILFVGYLDRNKALLDCYQAADIFVFASNTETQGLVLLEAMAKGVPVVSTAVMGTRDVLVDGEGCVIAQEKLDDFTAKVISVLKDSQLRRHLSETGRKYAKHWHAAVFAEQLASLYQAQANPLQQSQAVMAAGRLS